MSGSGEAAKPRWPGPVGFDDDDPRRGFTTLTLEVPELTVNKPLFGKPTSNAVVREVFQAALVAVTIEVNAPDGPVGYEYRKSLPLDIDPERTSYKLKQGKVILNLCKKTEEETWTHLAQHLVEKN